MEYSKLRFYLKESVSLEWIREVISVHFLCVKDLRRDGTGQGLVYALVRKLRFLKNHNYHRVTVEAKWEATHSINWPP